MLGRRSQVVQWMIQTGGASVVKMLRMLRGLICSLLLIGFLLGIVVDIVVRGNSIRSRHKAIGRQAEAATGLNCNYEADGG